MEQLEIEDIVARAAPEPWGEISKIPWHDEEFSKRMLREHLRQDHDAASRRFEIIDQHVEWIDATLLGGKPAAVLDLGCGPGFYSTRLAARGHRCTGIDFAPAAVAYARSQSDACEYRLEDIREAEFGVGYDLAMLIFGELNAFPPTEAAALLRRMRDAIGAAGRVLVEVHARDYVETLGKRGPSWFSAETSVFAAGPHVCLHEHWWHADSATTTERYFVFDVEQTITSFVSTTQAYTDAEYAALLDSAGLVEVRREPSTEGVFFLLAEPSA